MTEAQARLADEAFAPRLLSSDVAFAGRVWDVRNDVFEYPGGALTRHYVDHPGAVAVVALDEAERVLLVKQYRHPVRSREWEVPAGLMDVAGEPPLDTAKRELAEEADLQAAEWHLLADTAVSPGGSDERIRIFLARGLSPVAHDFVREGEEADMERRWVGIDEVVDAIRDGRVQNSVLVIGLLSAALERARGWTGLRDPGTPWDAKRRPAR